MHTRWQVTVLGLALLAIAFACGGDTGPFGEFPENSGYLRTAKKLVIFNADTHEVYRTIDLPEEPWPGDSHRLEMDEKGRIWIGYNQGRPGSWAILLGTLKTGVLVFSAEGDLEHEVKVSDDTECRSPRGGIAFAKGYAFIGCDQSNGKVLVVNTETMDIVKTLEVERPDPEVPRLSDFYIRAVEEVAGAILVIGSGRPPIVYDKVTASRSGVALVARIDPDALIVHDYAAELPPGSGILDVVEVDGMAWLLNKLSNIVERPPRTDIYVMDPITLEIVDSFNLPQPYPVWGTIGADGFVYIYHADLPYRSDADRRGGVSRIDPVTREEEYTRIKDPERGSNAGGFDVYRGQPCMALRSGLWCMNDDGRIDLKLPQQRSIGVLFAEGTTFTAAAIREAIQPVSGQDGPVANTH